MAAAAKEARRSSIEKMPITEPAFDRLPDEIIEQILQAADPNGFASLIVLNRKWRDVSQRAHLYLQHLTKCLPASTNLTNLSAEDDCLPKLRRLFAREVKRNLYDAYKRPKQTLIKLVSTSISSSSCPGGEGMQFNASPRGHHLLAYNSSRIYVIDVRNTNFEVKRELKIFRRPVSVCIKDDASLLALLSSEMQVDVFDLQHSPPLRRKSIILDNTPRTITLSPCGSVLAAAYEGGIEVSSLNPAALATDRRAVKCDAVDTLAFSFDGTQILGTTAHSPSPSTVVLTAPYYDPGSHLSDDSLSPMWTTSILFPNTSRDCSHAVLLQEGSQEEASWTFAYDRSFEAFRAVRIGDLRNGTTYFTGPTPGAESQGKLLPRTLPAATYSGELVSAGFHDGEVWVYGIPSDLDAVPEMPPSTSDGTSTSPGLGRNNSGRSGTSRPPSGEDTNPSSGRTPQWQLLCDKHRNTLVEGVKVSELPGVSYVRWVSGFGDTSLQERLVVTARGVNGTRLITDEENMDFVDGSRVLLLDFDYSIDDGHVTEVTIEVGTDIAEVLEEEQRDIATEVAIVRRRTVAQKRGSRGALLRSATTASRAPTISPITPIISLPQDDDTDDDPLVPRRIGQNPVHHAISDDAGEGEGEGEAASFEEMEALDAPYAHASPRSGTTLRRAATAAALDRAMHPRTADGRPIEYRRADGRREHPHESDADNWVPPPPPYQKEDPGDLPAFLRGPAVGPPPPSLSPTLPPLTVGTDGAMIIPPDRCTTAPPGLPHEGAAQSNGQNSSYPFPRPGTGNTSVSQSSQQDNSVRPVSRRSTDRVSEEEIYDVSPPESPREYAPVRVDTNISQLDASSEPQSAIVQSPATSPSSSTVEVRPAIINELREQEGSDRRPVPPVLGLHIPVEPVNSVQTEPGVEPSFRRLSNAQTWPLNPGPHPAQSSDQEAEYPATAPPTQFTATGFSAIPLPLPSSNQMASLNRRISKGNPRRLSGGLQIARRPVGRGEASASHLSLPPPSAGSWHTSYSEPDLPLIISTPKGVSGAFDPPSQQMVARVEPPLLAPIPRHFRPAYGVSPRPTIERLETIYSVTSQNGNPSTAHNPALAQQQHQPPSLVPTWLNAPAIASSRTSPGVARRASRAERSAAKNIRDAKKRGWKHKSKKRNKDADAVSTAGWTDVSTAPATKERKCIVM